MSEDLIACFPMYDSPETEAASDALWAGVRNLLGYGPERLTRGGDLWSIWQSPDLLLAQTCGLPYRAYLSGRVVLLATPDYGLPGCPPGYYNSVLVVRADDPAAHVSGFEGRRLAYNDGLSQSGWAAPMAYAGYYDVAFGGFVQTGTHLASAVAVAKGHADIAALDAQSWRMMQRYEPCCGQLRELARTRPTPALPYITALGRDPAPIRAALETAVDGLNDADRAVLDLQGIVTLPMSAYLSMPMPEPPPD